MTAHPNPGCRLRPVSAVRPLAAAAVVLLVAGWAHTVRSQPPAADDGGERAPAHPGPKPVVVYRTDFSRPPGRVWSKQTRSKTPRQKDDFLGEFTRQEVSLSLSDLPAHRFARVRFDLYVIRSWDGDHPEWGPDPWQLSVADGPVLLNTTFGYKRVESTQRFPDEPPAGGHPMETGAARVNDLGYVGVADAVYELSCIFPHTDRALRLNFAATGNIVGPEDESWGLDNVVVEVFAGPAPVTQDRLEALWGYLGGADGIKAREAQQTLIAAGAPAAAFLRRKLAQAGGPVWDSHDARVQGLIAQLGHTDWQRREQASCELARLGSQVFPALRAAAQRTDSQEVQWRIERLLKGGWTQALAPESLIASRAKRALAILTWAAPAPTSAPASRPAADAP